MFVNQVNILVIEFLTMADNINANKNIEVNSTRNKTIIISCDIIYLQKNTHIKNQLNIEENETKITHYFIACNQFFKNHCAKTSLSNNFYSRFKFR